MTAEPKIGDGVHDRLHGNPMEAVAPHAHGCHFVGYRKATRLVRQAMMEGGVKAGNLRNLWPGAPGQFDGVDRPRQMERGERDDLLQVAHQVVIDDRRSIVNRTAVDHAVRDGLRLDGVPLDNRPDRGDGLAEVTRHRYRRRRPLRYRDGRLGLVGSQPLDVHG